MGTKGRRELNILQQRLVGSQPRLLSYIAQERNVNKPDRCRQYRRKTKKGKHEYKF
jgi:hypothetical protein